MKTKRIIGLSGGAAAAALLLFLATPVRAVAPQAVNGTFLEIDVDRGGKTQNIKLSLGPDRLRMDLSQEMSLVSLGGDDGKMLMIQHAERQYMEFTAEMMQMMAGMMGRTPDQAREEIEKATPPTFVRTGNTKQVGEWKAYEVRVEHPDQKDETTMWFSQDVDADFRALAEQMVSSLSSLFSNPMLGRMTGSNGGADILAQIRSQMAAVDIPDGFPVQVMSNSGGTASINTLKAIDQNASFGPDTWEAPEGYAKMDPPIRR